MTFLHAMLLSLLQGATEFLPVSSSGHLLIARELFGVEEGDNVVFTVLVHFGTLLAIALVFWPELRNLVGYACFGGLRLSAREGLRAAWLRDSHGRMIVAIILATIPTALIGLGAKDFFEGLYEDPERVHWAGYALCATALLLAVTRWCARGEAAADDLSVTATTFPLWIAVAIGIVQGMAIVPGISRSGSTIAAALILGLSRRQAGEFSFLIAVPAVTGAVVLELPKMLDGAAGLSLSVGLMALVVSAASGWFFLKVLLRFVRGGQFAYFAIYCMAVGIWVVVRFS
jgi:undecaprenyl-diphosphatase